MFKKVLIANRGEIAVRIIRALKELDIKSVAVYSTADKDALFVHLADEAICIGSKSSRDSYLNIPNILTAATLTKCDAIHPGYGFLSENGKFAKMVTELGMKFIGPSYEAIEKMGNKSLARDEMIKAGIPVIKGTKGLTDPEKAFNAAKTIEPPVLIKASSGGGGKGMRIVNDMNNFIAAFKTAQQEAVSSFDDPTMYVEKFITNPRHIEFQILADSYGNVIHLGERDCSIQRRHQKMIEEAPSAKLDVNLRRKMGMAACIAASEIGYENAGTIEFLLDDNNDFYFIEMNTRIKVEHPVTEFVTGVDLIKEQIKIASGEKLSYTQEDIKIIGHSIECRINAENPKRNFMPSPGVINDVHFPGGKGVRLDFAIYRGLEITPFYDSMLGKLIVHDMTREEAIKKMKAALQELIIEGVHTNNDFLVKILETPEFLSGEYDTNFIGKVNLDE